MKTSAVSPDQRFLYAAVRSKPFAVIDPRGRTMIVSGERASSAIFSRQV